MKVLAIDTSNHTLGLALVDETTVVGEYITNLKKNHSVRVMPAIEMLLNDCGVKPKELTKIVVAKGPGSYTGVRIGLTIAKTLAWSLNIPVVGISSLALVAGVGRYFDGYISPLFDARRGQIYTGLYGFDSDGLNTIKQDQNVMAVDWAESLTTLNKNVLFVGNDTAMHRAAIAEILGDKAVFAEFTENNPRPSELALLGMHEVGDDLHSLVPNYIRLVEAEAKWLVAQQNQDHE
ncbi:tRNA (adenosine(37)-N6)-threonylcarbamoyltransferase complex dimerization subunit type 1 TsaB [Falsibacillus albus]|uniref:tRNA (Adenosine(37)-N6)-threonylcarbamoyltransferase complex dimerization subunit type 1 TsaB n=1 Tax=Falsibacillus albus TaxID=2478915 RepID=A0A3L7JLK7_9BACI|nr:tRNA (adenosine(37)-N6)-threonylcarbamoyltransferase complex dimerization subunit type 1 TsaB [Falsibacillus albus]RLQ91185.1 tRNA (adenosine(37)-N6)-threonylcarbamoyltransferase complex dimerization subunit type 1 TsaB [Falsibacillus albus]